MKDTINNLYTKPLPASRTGLFYNTFPYPTKIAPESIAVYIAAHTKPGDTVLDVFGGSGSTAIAALMCEHPNENMRNLTKQMGIMPQWGARNAVIYELGTYGAFASQVMTHPPLSKDFVVAATQLLREAAKDLGAKYLISDNNGDIGQIRHVIWSDVLCCPHCGKEYSYYSGMVRTEPIQILKTGMCPHCNKSVSTEACDYVTEKVYDNLLDTDVIKRKRIPARIYGETGSRKWWREATNADIERLCCDENGDYPTDTKAKAIEWGELRRSGYHTGITHLHHFYTRRNYSVMDYLWNATGNYPEHIRCALRLFLLSYNATHATLMTRVVAKKASKDFVLTGAQSGVLYISSLPVEKNILSGLERKINYFAQAFDYINGCSGKVQIFNSSSQHLQQDDASIDYMFTDPPFGDFIPYAEVNQINELWLNDTTNREAEIIISNSQSKTVSSYQQMMTDVFRETHRVLKDGANATVVFHASKASVWNALCAAYSDAGFRVEATSTLNKTQASFKQVVSESSVQGDPLILLTKGNAKHQEVKAYAILDEAIAENSDRDQNVERHIYSNYIGKCLEKGAQVQLDAKAAYAYISHIIGAEVNG